MNTEKIIEKNIEKSIKNITGMEPADIKMCENESEEEFFDPGLESQIHFDQFDPENDIF